MNVRYIRNKHNFHLSEISPGNMEGSLLWIAIEQLIQSDTLELEMNSISYHLTNLMYKRFEFLAQREKDALLRNP